MKRLNLGLESINFQDLAFFKEMTLVIEDIRKMSEKDLSSGEGVARLSACVKHHTKLNVVFGFGSVGPHIVIPQVSKNHPFLNAWRQNISSSAVGLHEVSKNGGVVRGGVSLLENKVSGIFEELQAQIEVPIKMLRGEKYTSEEVAAVILHEVGHLFTYFEYICRVVTTNQVLAYLSKRLDGTGVIEERENILISVKKAQNLDFDATKLARATDKNVVEAVVVTSIAKQATSELGRNIYDSTTWEMLSDQYVARCGGARPLASALDKLYGGSWHISFRSLPAYLLMEAVKLLTIVVSPFLYIVLCSIDGNGDNSYDRPGARIVRVRSQIVEQLKDRDLEKDDIDRLQQDLDVIDSILKDINDRRQFCDVVWDFVSPSARKDRNYENLQKELEQIATNDLFAKAAALRAITL